jgi:hypothetical protein
MDHILQPLDSAGAGLMVGRASGTHLRKAEVCAPITAHISAERSSTIKNEK